VLGVVGALEDEGWIGPAEETATPEPEPDNGRGFCRGLREERKSDSICLCEGGTGAYGFGSGGGLEADMAREAREAREDGRRDEGFDDLILSRATMPVSQDALEEKIKVSALTS
jgi:hypothetical protein